ECRTVIACIFKYVGNHRGSRRLAVGACNTDGKTTGTDDPEYLRTLMQFKTTFQKHILYLYFLWNSRGEYHQTLRTRGLECCWNLRDIIMINHRDTFIDQGTGKFSLCTVIAGHGTA